LRTICQKPLQKQQMSLTSPDIPEAQVQVERNLAILP